MTTPAAGLALYVHVPFCRTLCGYCDFYSRVLDPAWVAPFVDAVLRELDSYAAARALRCDTIYVGGGTPTVLPAAELGRLLGGLRRVAAGGTGFEFTVEANPATIDDEIAGVLAAAGVNRVSLGAQSFAAAELRALDRSHRPEQVGQTVAHCRRAGIRQISLDLIFGIPSQTLGSWLRSLRGALLLKPDHLSCYGLTYEPGTPLGERLAAGQVQRVDEDLEADMYEAALDLLPAAGLAHYEISNFARPGGQCRHNLHYWHNEPYLGLGPAAAGFIDEVRYRNVADLPAYAQAVQQGHSAWSEQERLPPARRARETAMLELRLAAGIDRQGFARRFGQDPVVSFAEAIARHAADGLLRVDASSIRLTRAGILLADRVSSDFV
jgi:oxygen-independent coproporphyrinogen-3 oxidase